MIHDLIVIGGGPAGLTAAIYAGRSAIKALVLCGGMPGGQIASTSLVENFPGFPHGISGIDLAVAIQEQAEHFGAELVYEMATELNLSAYPFVVKTHSETYQTRTLIVATGAFPRRIGVPGEQEFFGRGVSTCATCDGFLYKDKTTVVVGGGDSALDEGLFLTRFAREVIVIHRRDALRANKQLQERAFATPNMRFVWDSVVDEVLGEAKVSGVRVRNVKTGEKEVISTDGIFVYIGLVPATRLLQGQVELDEAGYVIADSHQRTSVPGVFAAGDVQNPDFRQCVVAAGSGAMAAMEAERYLSANPL